LALPSGLIAGATSLSVDVTFHTTADGVILGYQNQPLGVTPDQYMPALYVGTDGRLYAQIFDGSFRTLISGKAVNDGQQHHAVLVETGSAQSLYLDGALVGTLSGTPVPLNMTVDQLGTGYTLGHPGTPYGFFPFIGTLDSVQITSGTALAGSVSFPGTGANQITFTPVNPGGYMISFQVTQPDGGTAVSSASVTVFGAPAGVDIHGQPANGVVGQAIGGPITVAIVDALGNTVTKSTAPVTLAIASGPGGAKLGGTTTVRAVNGVATFTNLTVNEAGTYVLKATGGKLTPDFSNTFTVGPVNVTTLVKFARGALQAAGGGLFRQVLTITNTSAKTLSGPLAVQVVGLPGGTQLSNAAHAYRGSPYVDFLGTGQTLAARKSVTVELLFVYPGKHRPRTTAPSYTIEVLQGL
jgi:hypothetical protein